MNPAFQIPLDVWHYLIKAFLKDRRDTSHLFQTCHWFNNVGRKKKMRAKEVAQRKLLKLYPKSFEEQLLQAKNPQKHLYWINKGLVTPYYVPLSFRVDNDDYVRETHVNIEMLPQKLRLKFNNTRDNEFPSLLYVPGQPATFSGVANKSGTKIWIFGYYNDNPLGIGCSECRDGEPPQWYYTPYSRYEMVVTHIEHTAMWQKFVGAVIAYKYKKAEDGIRRVRQTLCDSIWKKNERYQAHLRKRTNTCVTRYLYGDVDEWMHRKCAEVGAKISAATQSIMRVAKKELMKTHKYRIQYMEDYKVISLTFLYWETSL